MNTEWSGSYICFPLPVLFSDISASMFQPPSLPLGLVEIHIDKKTMWDNIHDRGKGSTQEHPHRIPICALAPTVPRTLVHGVGWNGYSSQIKPVNVDSAGPE
jgi:hypothetical protein